VPIFNLEEMEFEQKRPRVFMKAITGEKSQLCVIRLDYGEKTFHEHKEEQFGVILNGSVELTIGEEKKIIFKDYAYYIPANTPHGFNVVSTKGVEFIEFFCPPKKENMVI
jgi:mannose-6-phosphate isomerase-like protein (cupin superfamily)